ncbi:MAG: universal stress protein [Deltaproteobacteria bacterium]|nr:universal stress protein [Deltaproteobacteria bacterium]
MSPASSEPMLLGSHMLEAPLLPGKKSPGAERATTYPASIREIVVCLDGSEFGSGIVPHAQLVAKTLGARLTLLHVVESESASGGARPDPLDWEIRQREARTHLEGLAAPLVELEYDIRVEVIQGLPAEQICAWVEREGVDLTVLCSHGARGLSDWNLASTARKLIERTPGSLLLVPAAAAVKGAEVRYRRILVPLDGSPRAESAVPMAARIAASQNAELLLVHVVSVPEITRIGPLDAEGAELERRLSEHNRRLASVYLDRLRTRTSQQTSGVRAIVTGDETARAGLERLIREQEVDLVVMSAHGLTGRTDCHCGSVTEYALMHATTPLLVIRDRIPHRARRVGPSSDRLRERLGTSSRTAL